MVLKVPPPRCSPWSCSPPSSRSQHPVVPQLQASPPLPGAAGSWPRFVGETVTRAQTGTEWLGAHRGASGPADAGCWGILGSAACGAGKEEDKSWCSRQGCPGGGGCPRQITGEQLGPSQGMSSCAGQLGEGSAAGRARP